ncbi:MAG: YceI family protein [Deltaproteobacteria bacterium]|nr:YceI family protein [Deltaproteobacteria bacterium]
MRSPFAPVILPLVALIASLVRWKMQGSGNLYTALEKRLYVPDPDLGWRISSEQPIWLGLEVCGVIAGIAVGCAVGGFLIKKLRANRPRLAKGLWIAAWTVGAATLIVPIAAFASGGGIDGARDTLPERDAKAAAIDGIEGALDLPAGRYEVITHSGTSITARISAGGESFDARLAGDMRGTFVGNPKDLRAPLTADASVSAASVDTGITPRSNSARDEYLQSAKHPRITFVLVKLVAAKQQNPNQVTYRATGKINFVGKEHVVEVAGTLAKPDDAAKARLGLEGTIMLVQADLSLVIKETALAPDAGDFDGDRIPIHVSLVLRHTGGG